MNSNEPWPNIDSSLALCYYIIRNSNNNEQFHDRTLIVQRSQIK